MKTNQTDLLPCPFCGNSASVETKILDHGTWEDFFFRVVCDLRECGVMTRRWSPLRAAVQSWNRRVAQVAGHDEGG